MEQRNRPTLAEFVVEERRAAGADEELGALLCELACAFKTIATAVRRGALAGPRAQEVAGLILTNSCESRAELASVVFASAAQPQVLPAGDPRRNLLVFFSALENSAAVELNGVMGTLFSVFRHRPQEKVDSCAAVPGRGLDQICAGYTLHGPATMIVLTVGNGTHGFTLDPGRGQFLLTHPGLRVRDDNHELSVDGSAERRWEPPLRRYVEECLEGRAGPRQSDFRMAWSSALVPAAHRILLRGGVLLHPLTDRAAGAGGLSLVFDANPLAFLVEQAGGAASTGYERVLELIPGDLHQRIPVILGARSEVERLVRYHEEFVDGVDQPYSSLLFARRSLFIER